ncbi:MAG: NUDIX domain-containing protein [Candidatus Pacebacteria bacterium]|nr:NUDIX domain-containing protein [Candidatus Paceibacterota bacterium]
MSKNEIEILARAVILHKEKILVCKKIGNQNYFFPGGHVDFGECAKEALIREIKEELGVSVKNCSFIGTSEQIFKSFNKWHHEINLVFQLINGNIAAKSKEKHLQFFFFGKNDLAKTDVRPLSLKKAVLKWLNDGKLFWVSQIEK